MFEAPNYQRRSKCLSAAPQRGKILPANSAAVEASAVSGGQLPHIGRFDVHSTVRLWRPLVGRGASNLPFLRLTTSDRRICDDYH